MKKKLFSIMLSLAMVIAMMPMQNIEVEAKTKAKTKTTVSTQAGLKKALKNKKLKSLTIKTTKRKNFSIPKSKHKKVNLYVDAPNSDVKNSCLFRKITIKKIASDTWNEQAKGNILICDTSKCHIVVPDSSEIKEIKMSKSNSNLAMDVSGNVKKITVLKKASLDINGMSKDSIKVNVLNGANGTLINSNVKLDVNTVANTIINLNKGAEDSIVKADSENIFIEIANNTNSPVKLTNSAGKIITVKPKVNAIINANGNTISSSEEKENQNPSGGGFSQDDINKAKEEGIEEGKKLAEAEALKAAKENAIKDVSSEAARANKLADTNLSGDAMASANAAINTIKASAEASITDATGGAAVEDAKDLALDKLCAIEELIAAAGKNPSEGVQDELKNAVEAVKNAENETAVETAKDNGIKAIDAANKALEEAKDSAKQVVSSKADSATARVDKINLASENATSIKSAIDTIKSNGFDSISAESEISKVNEKRDEAKAKLRAIEDLLDAVGSNPSADIQNILKDAVENIKNGVSANINEIIEQIKAQQAEELEAKILEALKTSAKASVKAQADKTNSKLDSITLSAEASTSIADSTADIVASANASIDIATDKSEVSEARDLANARLIAIRIILGLIDASKLPRLITPYMVDAIANIKDATRDETEEIVDAALKYDGKGALITLTGVDIVSNTENGVATADSNDDEFRVIKVNGNQVELLAMNGKEMRYNDASKTKTFSDGNTYQKYEGSTLDNYLNTTYYNALKAKVGNDAIVDQDITQHVYSHEKNTQTNYALSFEYYWSESNKRWAVDKGYVHVGGVDEKRHVYALDVADIAEYVGASKHITGAELNTMFFGQETLVYRDCWLRSASTFANYYAWNVYGSNCSLDDSIVYSSNNYEARAAFTINLNKVKFTLN